MQRSMRILLLLLAQLLVTEAAMAVEEPAYEVLEAAENFELRRYVSYVVAEVEVDAGFEAAGNRAFRVLADYIFGNNVSRTKMAMTAPVTQRAGERMAMTAPVTQSGSEGGYVVAFVLPAGYTLDSAPEPVNPAVRLRRVPPRLVAARRYRGRWTEGRFREEESALRAALADAALPVTGATEYARYDPPFMPSFLRRNEVLLEVSPPEA